MRLPDRRICNLADTTNPLGIRTIHFSVNALGDRKVCYCTRSDPSHGCLSGIPLGTRFCHHHQHFQGRILFMFPVIQIAAAREM
jgi:hypothetical protein